MAAASIRRQVIVEVTAIAFIPRQNPPPTQAVQRSAVR